MIIKHEWTCEVQGCIGVHVDEVDYGFGDEIPVPTIPRGWMQVGEDLVSDRHQVCVFTLEESSNPAIVDAQKRAVLKTVFGEDALPPEQTLTIWPPLGVH